ncbi:isoamylase early set domain-containing protein [Mangrovibacterium diazotrophicum]|uniref:AMP-activated protein kinase-like protein n=1 Tax=Mangrovibacterium diazotrophicum TaxID=1261403 RepID=A0A419W7R0_9BACT|nr:isoamylase early set domain-containing protein [Mangrovibacterium diazotrophicum]RKD91521.1 AMP-activated protein kinase-like protein [Mangrovibacterium diazotrophicum]
MSIKRQYLKGKQLYKVTFRLINGNGLDAKNIRIIGEFNDWDFASEPMEKSEGGVFTKVLELDADQEYQFRYLVDNKFWENDPDADDLVPSGTGKEDYNSVIVL